MVRLQRLRSLPAARRGALRSTHHKQFVPRNMDLPAVHCPWVLVRTGAGYWNGVGGFMFNSSSSYLRTAPPHRAFGRPGRQNPCVHPTPARPRWELDRERARLSFLGAGGRLPKARRGFFFIVQLCFFLFFFERARMRVGACPWVGLLVLWVGILCGRYSRSLSEAPQQQANIDRYPPRRKYFLRFCLFPTRTKPRGAPGSKPKACYTPGRGTFFSQ